MRAVFFVGDLATANHFARWDDGSGSASDDHIVAFARVLSPICRDRGNLLVGWNLFQQVRRHGCITDIACRDAGRAISGFSSFIPRWSLRHRRSLGSPCLQAFYSPSPSALIPVASNQQVQRTGPSAIVDGDP